MRASWRSPGVSRSGGLRSEAFAPPSAHSVTALVSSPLSRSRIGLAGNESLADDVAAGFRLETYFNPTSGNDGLKSRSRVISVYPMPVRPLPRARGNPAAQS
jgi:hypothetical protein